MNALWYLAVHLKAQSAKLAAARARFVGDVPGASLGVVPGTALETFTLFGRDLPSLSYFSSRSVCFGSILVPEL